MTGANNILPYSGNNNIFPNGVNNNNNRTVLPNIIRDRKTKKEYRAGSLLGTGGFARVFRVIEANSHLEFADKVICKTVFREKTNSKQKVEREITIHRKLDHVHVVKFFTYFEDRCFVHMLLELCPQKTLLHVSKYRKTLHEWEVRYYTRQILLGLHYIHTKGFLHRDLKLGNMFLSSRMIVKIGDFGLATRIQDNKPGSLCGTPNYIAPEVLAKQGHSTSSEVWSVGCMVYALLCGTPPFQTESISSTYALITACSYSLPSHLSSSSVSLLTSILTLAVSSRATLPSLLYHSFLTKPVPESLPVSALTTVPECPSVSSTYVKEESPCDL